MTSYWIPDGDSGLICGDRKFGTAVSLQAASAHKAHHREAGRQAGAQPRAPESPGRSRDESMY